ncbi:MAG: hypothetical protein ACYC11_11200, partial [Bellilinea sp.]
FDPIEILNKIKFSMDALSRISSDSKFEALRSYLQYQPHNKGVLVVCGNSDTRSYLYSSLTEEVKNVYQFPKNHDREMFDRTLSEFNHKGGVFLASIESLKGLDINLDEIIFYEYVKEPLIFFVALRLLLPSINFEGVDISFKKKIVTFMRDTSKAIPTEEDWLDENIETVRRLLENRSPDVRPNS